MSEQNFTHAEGVSLKEYFDSQMKSMSHALTLAHGEMERRLETMNDLRGQLARQAGTFMTRVEFDFQHRRLEEDVKSLLLSRSELSGKASVQSVIIGYVFSTITLIVSIVAVLHTMAK